MAAKKKASPEPVAVSPDGGDPGVLARLVDAAEPGACFVIAEGVYGPIIVARDVSIAARPGANAQAVHLVGSEGRPAITVRGGTLALRGLMVSAPDGDGVVVEAGSVVLTDCLLNTPEGAPLVLPPGTKATLDDCFVGGGALRVEGGELGLQQTRFGHTSGDYGLHVTAGTLDVQEGGFLMSTPLLQGAKTRASFRACTFEAGIRNGLEARAGASVELVDCRFLEGFVGVLVDGAELSARDLVFADQHGRFPQLRAAIRALDGAKITLATSVIRGAASVVAGMTKDGLLEARPWFEEPAQTDVFPKVAIVVAGGSQLVCEDVTILQRDFGALLLTDASTASFVGGEIRASGRPLILEGTAVCTLRKTRLRGTADPLVAAGARLSLHGTKLTRNRADQPPRKAVVPRQAQKRERLIVDAAGKGDSRTLREALAFGKELPPIVLRAGRYRESISVHQALTIVAEGEVIWEAEKDEPCLTARAGRVEIRGVRFRGRGNVEDALVVSGGHLVLHDCHVEGGRCSLRIDEGNADATGCTFGRSAIAGVLSADGELSLTDCVIASIDNKPGHGLQATEDAHVSLIRCHFRDLAGHAIYATVGSPVVEAREIHASGIGRSAVCVLGNARVLVQGLTVVGETGEARLKVGEQGALSLDGQPIEASVSSV